MANNKTPKLKGVKYNDKEDIYNYTSFTNHEKEYLVMCQDRVNRKDWTCTCYDFMYRRKGKKQDCKHITRIKFIDECRLKIDHLLPQNKGLLPSSEEHA